MIDSHIHFWRVARGDNTGLDPASPLYRDHEPDELAPQLAAAGVDRIVVVAAAETHAENLYTIGLALAHPRMIAGVVPWVDLKSPALAEEIVALRGTGVVRGVRPVVDGNASIAWMRDVANEAGYAAVAAASLPLDVLIEDPDDLPVVIAVAEHHPELTIVLDHCGKPDIAGGRWEPWAAHIATLAALPNVVCKLSGLLARAKTGDDIRSYARHIIGAFGPSRLLWASDWPPLTRNSSYAIWRDISAQLLAELSPDERRSVQAGTAQRIYRL